MSMVMDGNTKASRPIWAALVLLPFMGGYFLSYLLRNAHATISGRLIAEFGFGPRELGVLTALYFLSSAMVQIPAGLLIDRFGPRRVQVLMMLLGALGAAGFGFSQDTPTLMLSRGLIGLGTSTSMVAGFKAVALWVPEARRMAARSCLVGSGGLGAMVATLPTEWAAEALGWRLPFLGLAVLLVVLALVLARMPEWGGSNAAKWRDICGGLGVILRDQRFWRVVPLAASLTGGVFAIQGLWAARWLVEVYGLNSAQSSAVLFAMGCGFSAGAPLFGWLGRMAQRRGIPISQLFGTAALLLLATEAAIAWGAPVPPFLLLGVFASFGAVTILGFSLMDGLFPPAMAGRASAAFNVVQMGATFAIHIGFGAIVARWAAQPDSPAAEGYAAATVGVMAIQALGFLWFVRPEPDARPSYALATMELVK